MPKNGGTFQCNLSYQLVIFIYHRKHGNISFFHLSDQNLGTFFTQTGYGGTGYHNTSCRYDFAPVHIFYKSCHIVIGRFS